MYYEAFKSYRLFYKDGNRTSDLGILFLVDENKEIQNLKIQLLKWNYGNCKRVSMILHLVCHNAKFVDWGKCCHQKK